MKKVIQIKLNLSKADKDRLFKGEKGVYLDAVLFLNDEADQYGNHGMIVQSVSKEERDAGVKGEILGNAKFVESQGVQPLTQEDKDDLPF
jgi:hypothetical protein